VKRNPDSAPRKSTAGKATPVIDRIHIRDTWGPLEKLDLSLAERMQSALKGREVAAVAASLGVAPTTLYRWMEGKFEPSLAKLTELAAVLGVPASWLLTGDKYRPIDFEPARGKSPIAFNEEWLDSVLGKREGAESRPVLVEARDDSMEPTISRGDLVLADRAGAGEIEAESEQGRSAEQGIYVFQSDRAESSLVIRRRHYRLDGTMVISCDNTKYPDESYPAKAKTRPVDVGRVIWRGGRI